MTDWASTPQKNLEKAALWRILATRKGYPCGRDDCDDRECTVNPTPYDWQIEADAQREGSK